jgi:hypothetical protein
MQNDGMQNVDQKAFPNKFTDDTAGCFCLEPWRIIARERIEEVLKMGLANGGSVKSVGSKDALLAKME